VEQSQEVRPEDMISSKFDEMDEIEYNSAFGHEDMLKIRMYQDEIRYSSQTAAQIAAARREMSTIKEPRPISVIDYNEYRKLEDKKDRILLKKTLYEHKQTGDQKQVGLLNTELDRMHGDKEVLNRKLDQLRETLD